MVAFHAPPLRGSSGIQRTIGFAKYLPDFGWEPHILSAHPRAYEATDNARERFDDLPIHRAFALDAARHLGVFGRYPGVLALPDRWVSWWLGAVPAGLRLIRRLRPAALWSTYPIATAHMIGHSLARMTGLPWIADFRDPMAQDGYPSHPVMWKRFLAVESRTVARARASVFTTPSAVEMYRQRYPERSRDIHLLENGYDEAMFAGLGQRHEKPGNPLVLLHSGIVYPSERDPSMLLQALQWLRERQRIGPEQLRIRFRAPVHAGLLRELADRYDVVDMVEIAPPVAYRDALEEMVMADGLLVMQAANCNEQIPAKVYEYMRAGRPILGLADPEGDTAATLRQAGIGHIAALENMQAIVAVLERFIADLREGRAGVSDAACVRSASRQERTAGLAAILDSAVIR